MERFTALIGLGVILAIAYAMSNNKRRIPWRVVAWGLGLQFVLAVAVLKGKVIASLFDGFAPPLETWGAALIFIGLAIVVTQIAKRAPEAAARPLWIVFAVVGGFLLLAYNLLAYLFETMRVVVNSLIGYTSEGAQFVFGNLAKADGPVGFVFAAQVLPTIICIASIFAILYYL